MEVDNRGAYKSPGGKHGFNFIFLGEIRFGPEYHRLQLDGDIIPDRIFGFEFKWHPESKYLALQEWLTTDFKKGPITALTLVDLSSKKFARISKAKNGFMKPLSFKEDAVIFEKVYYANGVKTEHEIKLSEIENWEN